MHRKAYEEAAATAKGQTVLDLGCNVGYGTAILASTAARAVGIDVSDQAIQEARSRFPAAEFQVVDGMRLPFADGSFDLLTSMQVIEHIVDYDNYLSEIRRVLRPGGTAFFATPNSRLRLESGDEALERHPLPRVHRRGVEGVAAPFLPDRPGPRSLRGGAVVPSGV